MTSQFNDRPPIPGGAFGAKRKAAALLAGSALFLLNDVFYTKDNFALWLAEDYGVRAIVVALCLIVARPSELRLTRPLSIADGIFWAILMFVVTVVADRLLRHAFPVAAASDYPAILSPGWLVLDTIVGIPLVAASEELLARGLFLTWAEKRWQSNGAIIIASATLFSAFHWSLGTASIVTSALFGILAMMSLQITRSLWPALIAHYAADIALFSVPQWLDLIRSPG